MTSKERVRTALSHKEPDRVPFAWGFCATPEMHKVIEKYFAGKNIDWCKLNILLSDTRGIDVKYTGPKPEDGNTFTGIWGIKLKNTSYGMGEYAEFTDFPLAGITETAPLHDYPWPNPDNYDYASIGKNFLSEHPDNDKAVQFFAGNPFEIYCWMTGLEEAMINLLVSPEVVTTALSYITNFFKKRLENVLNNAGSLIDIVFFADDLGSQTGPLMSKDTYLNIIQPFHKELADTVKNIAPHAYTMFHSDGAVFDLLPAIIDAGMDIHEAVQVDAAGMEPEKLKKTYGDRLSFHGGISVQQLLPNSDAETVKQECKRLISIFGENGGYIAAPSHAIQMGTPPENIEAMLEAVFGDEQYKLLPESAEVSEWCSSCSSDSDV